MVPDTLDESLVKGYLEEVVVGSTGLTAGGYLWDGTEGFNVSCSAPDCAPYERRCGLIQTSLA